MFQRFCIFALISAQWANKDHVKAFALLPDRDISTTVSSLSSGTPHVEVQPEALGEALWYRDQVWRKLVNFFFRQLAKAFWALGAHDLAYCSSKNRFLCFSHHCRHPSGVWAQVGPDADTWTRRPPSSTEAGTQRCGMTRRRLARTSQDPTQLYCDHEPRASSARGSSH